MLSYDLQKIIQNLILFCNTDMFIYAFIFFHYTQRSVNAFFEAKTEGGVKVLQDGAEPEVVVTFE